MIKINKDPQMEAEKLKIMQVIEITFGEKWLIKKINRGIKTGVWGQNPIPKGYYELEQKTSHSTNMEISKEEKITVKLSRNITKIQHLKNYSTCIPIKKLKGTEFEKYAYHIHIAALAVDYNFEVEFIPENGITKTPDLLLRKDDIILHAECKKRDNHKIEEIDKEKWKNIQEKILSLLEENNADYSVSVIFTSKISLKNEDEFYISLDEIIKKSEAGVFINNNEGYALHLEKLEKTYNEYGPIIPTKPNKETFAVAQATYNIDANGNHFWEKIKRVQLYLINSHGLSNIIESNIRDARQQIPKSSTGIIYIDIDMSQIDHEDHQFYLNILNESLKRILVSRDNLRIGAIVISGEINNWDYIYMTIRNPLNNTLKNIILPGEKARSM